MKMSSDDTYDEVIIEEPQEIKPKRGRPRKNKTICPKAKLSQSEIKEPEPIQEESIQEPETQKRTRGRPRKEVDPNKPPKPKRKCSEKQLAALAEGRKKNKRFHPKESE